MGRYINTAQEFDGCDSGARPDEAVSWGKIRIDAKPVKVYTEATLVLPLIIGKCFAPRVASGEWERTRGDGTRIVRHSTVGDMGLMVSHRRFITSRILPASMIRRGGS